MESLRNDSGACGRYMVVCMATLVEDLEMEDFNSTANILLHQLTIASTETVAKLYNTVDTCS